MSHPPQGPSPDSPPPGPKGLALRGTNPHPSPPEPGPGHPPQPVPRVASTRDIGTRITSAPFGQTRGRYGYALPVMSLVAGVSVLGFGAALVGAWLA